MIVKHARRNNASSCSDPFGGGEVRAINNISLLRAGKGAINAMQRNRSQILVAALAFAPFLSVPAVAANNVVANPICLDNTANFNPTLPPSIVLPPGFTASVFASGLNFPTGIAFLGDSQNFQVSVLESGHGLGGSRCNEQGSIP